MGTSLRRGSPSLGTPCGMASIHPVVWPGIHPVVHPVCPLYTLWYTQVSIVHPVVYPGGVYAGYVPPCVLRWCICRVCTSLYPLGGIYGVYIASLYHSLPVPTIMHVDGAGLMSLIPVRLKGRGLWARETSLLPSQNKPPWTRKQGYKGQETRHREDPRTRTAGIL